MKIRSVIHFAGLKAVGESVRIPLKYVSASGDIRFDAGSMDSSDFRRW
jgi:hypothetical protein